jgi:guanylate cyclase
VSPTEILERLSTIGARPDESRDERLRAGALILASILVALLSFVWVITYAVYGLYRSAAIPATYQVLTVVGLVVLARTKSFARFRTTQLVMFLVLPPLLQLSLGGFDASSGIALWSMATPLAALALLGTRRATPWLWRSSRSPRGSPSSTPWSPGRRRTSRTGSEPGSSR